MAYADLEKRRAYQREWHRKYRAANPGIDEVYRKATKEERAAERRKARAKPDSNHKEVLKKSYYKHKERRLAESQAWRKANPEKYNLLQRACKAKRRAAEGKYTIQDIEAIFIRQDGKCAAKHCLCDISRDFEIDHILPIARGGTNWPQNIQLLCKDCNRSKGSKTEEEWQVHLVKLRGNYRACIS